MIITMDRYFSINGLFMPSLYPPSCRWCFRVASICISVCTFVFLSVRASEPFYKGDIEIFLTSTFAHNNDYERFAQFLIKAL